MKTFRTDVLVVGAGPAGLTASALLARAGVDALTVSKYPSTADSPRAHITNQRTVEVMRDLGAEADVVGQSMPQDLMGQQIFAASFAGLEFSRAMAWGAGHDRCGDYARSSPSAMCNISQHNLEPIILAAALRHGAEIRFGSELVGLEQDGSQVVARVIDRATGEQSAIHARYVLGADGGRSLVAKDAGIAFEGETGLGEAISVWLDADLTRFTRHRSGAIAFITPLGSDVWMSVWPCVTPWTEWNPFFFRHSWSAGEMSEEVLRSHIAEAIGDASVDFRIKKIARWQINHMVASTYRQGRVFIAGDAAHRHPPANGLGSNTSIQDAYNLAWKLALVVNDRAGEGLLDTYSQERQPVGRQVIDRAIQSWGEIKPWSDAVGLRPDLTAAETEANVRELFGANQTGVERRRAMIEGIKLMDYQFNAHGVELGQRYSEGAVVQDGTPFPQYDQDAELYYQQTTHPGACLPHVWVEKDGRRLSTLDLCGYDRFTLITGTGGEAWRQAAEAVSADLSVPIGVAQVGLRQEFDDPFGDWVTQRETPDHGCLLVRPDRFIAWRSQGETSGHADRLLQVMRKILDLPAATPMSQPTPPSEARPA